MGQQELNLSFLFLSPPTPISHAQTHKKENLKVKNIK